MRRPHRTNLSGRVCTLRIAIIPRRLLQPPLCVNHGGSSCFAVWRIMRATALASWACGRVRTRAVAFPSLPPHPPVCTRSRPHAVFRNMGVLCSSAVSVSVPPRMTPFVVFPPRVPPLWPLNTSALLVGIFIAPNVRPEDDAKGYACLAPIKLRVASNMSGGRRTIFALTRPPFLDASRLHEAHLSQLGACQMAGPRNPLNCRED